MKMKVIIVEDEPRVRKGLSEIIDWNSCGMELAGTATNGQEGLELFEQYVPDLVVADIRMPVMDGLAMTEAILGLKPDTKVLMISGHDEFEYAKRCIALGVTNYLLKPIGKKTFYAELEKLHNSWLEERGKKEYFHSLEMNLKQRLPVLKNTFLEEWLGSGNHLSREAIKDDIAFLQIRYDLDMLAAIAIFELDYDEGSAYTSKDRKLLEYAMHMIVEEKLGSFGVSYQRGNGQTVVVYQAVSSDLVEDLMDWAEKVKQIIGSALKVMVTVGVGSRAVLAHELHHIFQEAQNMLRLKLTLGTNIILSDNMIRPDRPHTAVLYESEAALLIHAVEKNDKEEIASVIDQLFNNWKDKSGLIYIDEVSYQFMGLFTSLAHRLGKSIRQYIAHDQLSKWREPELFHSLAHMKEWWKLRFIELSESYEGFRSDRKTKLVEQVIAYFDEHIYDNVSREDAANYVHINASYLSRLFKDVTNESLSDYVLRTKMEKAIHLLQVDRVMVYEVADRLGYKDPSYFARVFKKYTGKSPSDFQ